MKSGLFLIHVARVFQIYFRLKIPFFTLFKWNFITLKISNHENQTLRNALKKIAEWDALQTQV